MVLPKGSLKHISPKLGIFDCQDIMLGGRVLQQAGSSYRRFVQIEIISFVAKFRS
jgi:hypothetical protein